MEGAGVQLSLLDDDDDDDDDDDETQLGWDNRRKCAGVVELIRLD